MLAAFVVLPIVFLPQTFDPFMMPRQAVLLLVAPLAALVTVRRRAWLPRSRVFWVPIGMILVAEVLAWMASVDRRGSVLGNLGYRFGIVTHLALLAGFVIAATGLRRERDIESLLRLGLGVTGVVVAYAFVQLAGLDPFNWAKDWDQPFSSLGNPNDLAGFMVLSLAFVGGTKGIRKKRVDASMVAVLIVIVLTGLLTRSRSGLAGLIVTVGLLPLLCGLAGWPRREVRRMGAAIVTAMLLAGLVTAASGDLQALASRAERTFTASDSQSLGVRASIWKGSLASYNAHRAFGTGQDGLLVSFSRHRPGDLGSPFDEPTGTGIDPLVGSPHSMPLEVLVTTGPLGLAGFVALAVLVGRHAWRVVRVRRVASSPFIVAASMGFVLTTLVNPLSIATMAVAVVFAGALVAMSNTPKNMEPPTAREGRQRLWLVCLFAIPGLTAALLLLAADRAAFFAGSADASGDEAGSLLWARRARTYMPLESAYWRIEAQAAANLALDRGDVELLADAERLQVRFLRTFPGFANDYLLLARLRMLLGASGAEEALLAASEASPYGLETASAVRELREGRSR